MEIKQRLNPWAESLQEVKDYYSVRAMQAYLSDFIWSGKVELVPSLNVFSTEFTCNCETYHSFYIPASMRHKGVGSLLAKKILAEDLKIMTHPGCNITEWLDKNKIHYHLLYNVTTSREYRIIQDSYQGMYARRSGVHYMYHIDEGLMILKDIGASEDAMKAFCLHPLLQSDESILETFDSLTNPLIAQKPLALAMEYRHVANNWLSGRIQNGWHTSTPKLSPLKEVNDMLIADKIQNYKDFLLYNKLTHERSGDLDLYFRTWLEVLNVPLERYRDIMSNIHQLQRGK